MSLADLINRIDIIPDEPSLEIDTYVDNRTKAYLLYRDSERIDVLIVPFGDHIKGKKDLSHYIRFLPNNICYSTTFQDAEIKEHELRNGCRYLTVEDKSKKAIIPFKLAKPLEEIPCRIMGNSFTKRISECNEQVLTEIIDLLEAVYEFDRQQPTFGEIKSMMNRTLYLTEMESRIYNPLRESIEEAFAGEESPSTKLSFLERKVQHVACKDVINYCPEPKTIRDIAMAYLKTWVKDPVMHAALSTQENTIFEFLPNQEEFKDVQRFVNYIKSESGIAYFAFKEMMKENQDRAAKRYHRYVVLGAIGSLITGNYLLGAGLFALYGIEHSAVKYNRKETGIPTGMIGTIRDKLGLTIKPFNKGLISEDFDIGMWRKKDLE